MHFARTEEQDELASVVASLLDRRSDSGAVRAAMASEQGYDETLWRALCDQVGVTALPIPEEYAGYAASLVETAVVLEELGRNLAPSPLLATSLATVALLVHGSPEQRAELLPRIAAGEPATVVTGELVLNGTTAAIILAVGDAGLAIADSDVERVGTLDQTISLGRLDGAAPLTGPLLHVAWALTSALQVGTAQRGLDMTVSYSKERVQFGRPIGSFQALKHRMADMLVLVEASRSASWGATAAASAYVQEPTDERAAVLARRAAVARSYCSDALDHVAAETVQLHGGIAITWEHDAHLVLKRAHALGQLWAPAHAARASLLP
jgi:alkylation response protein AidB-like acyl-CoA dehydrogenase